jgi:tRNA G26 N,N-dimethylase Trm1
MKYNPINRVISLIVASIGLYVTLTITSNVILGIACFIGGYAIYYYAIMKCKPSRKSQINDNNSKRNAFCTVYCPACQSRWSIKTEMPDMHGNVKEECPNCHTFMRILWLFGKQ